MPFDAIFRALGELTTSDGGRRRNGRQARAPLGLEDLEDRRLLAATLVKDINSGAPDSTPAFFAELAGETFFAADNGTDGVELWKSDGNGPGTVLVKDIQPGTTVIGGVTVPLSSNPANLTTVGGTVFFTADDGTNGVELWKTDGTTAGTVLVKNIRTGADGSNPTQLVDVGGTLYFVAEETAGDLELWKSDGTAGGTVRVEDIRPGAAGSNPTGLTNVGGTLFFAADDGTNGAELWTSDGTLAGTNIVTNIFAGAGGSNPTSLTNVGGTLFFAANDGVAGNELWKSDGTAAGTVLVSNVRPGLASSNPANLVDVGGTLFFAADDGTNGVELWKSAGTAATTTLVKDINPNGSDSSNPAGLTNVDGRLFFRANDGTNGNELWTSDGTTAGTVLVLDIKPGALGSTPASLINGNGTLFFTADDGTNGAELWQSDGTPGGTLLVTDIRPGAEGSLPDGLFAVGRTLFFRADDGTNGTELWKADLPNAKPIANADSFTFTPGVALVVAAPGVLANDTDAEGSPLTAVLVTGPANGVLALNADGSFSYTPNAGFRGSDSFTYQAHDGTDASAQAAEVTLSSQDFGFIERLYIDLLGRTAAQVSDAEVTFWIGQLAGGATRVQVVQAFQGSTEYRINLIDGFYQDYLGRPADPGALSFFEFQLSQGLPIEALQAILLASNEYFLNAGTDALFVESLYDDLLGRTASVQETGFWRQQLFSGVSRFSVASAFLATNEYRVRLVNQLYQDLLARPVDAGALSFWLAQMQLGLSRQTLQLVLAASDEYFLL